jgi:hypothetical protein
MQTLVAFNLEWIARQIALEGQYMKAQGAALGRAFEQMIEALKERDTVEQVRRPFSEPLAGTHTRGCSQSSTANPRDSHVLLQKKSCAPILMKRGRNNPR